jgi:hypothetical protein
MPEIVDPAERLDADGLLGRLPVAVAEVVQIEVAAVRRRKQQLARRA